MAYSINGFTKNELKASVVLLKRAMDGCGHTQPLEFEHDMYTWVDASDLQDAGWSKAEAAGTYGALIEKEVISSEPDGDSLEEDFWRWAGQADIWEQIKDLA